MANGNNRGVALRVTALTAALLGVYGVASAAPSIDCSNTTCSAEDQNLIADAGKHVVQARDKAVVNITGGSITGNGKGEKGVLAMTGSTINVNNVLNLTTVDAHSVQAFGVDDQGNASKVVLNGATIRTNGTGYALGVQAYDKGQVSGTNVLIDTNGVNGSGVEAERGGVITLTSGHIKTVGAGAAGARAYGGTTNVAGKITLDGMHIETAGDSAIGLMAGDEDGPSGPRTAGNITFRNANVVTKGANAFAARVESGSNLAVENSTLTSEKSHGLVVRNTGSTAVLNNVSVRTTGAGTGWGDMPVGVYAADGGNVSLTGGSVAASGATYTRAVLATTGSTVVTNDTAISTKGSKSHAVQSHVEKDDTSIAVPSVTINRGTVTTEGDESWGLYALRGGQITSSADIITHGNAGFGVFVEGNNEANARGGLIKLNGGSVTTTGGAKVGTDIGSYGVLAKNKGNRVEIDGTTITTNGATAEALRIEDGASIAAKNATVKTLGTGLKAGSPVIGAHAAAVLSGSSLDLTGGSLTTLGDGYALYIADANSKVSAKNTAISTKGRHGVYVTGGGSATLEGGSITSTSGSNSARAVTAEFDSTVKISGGAIQIAASGDGSNTVVGVQALDGASVILDKGTSIVTTGARALGMRSTVDLRPTASSSISASSINVATTGGGSHALAAYVGSTITADNSQVSTAGAGAYGAHARDGGKVTLSNSTISTSGVSAVGMVAEATNASSGSGALVIANSAIKSAGEAAHGIGLYGGGSSINMTGGSISASGKDSAGLFASNSSTATLTGVKVTSAGPSVISRFRTAGTQTITLGSNTYLTENNGTLLRVDRESGGENGTVNLNLNAGSFAAGNILDKDATGKVSVKRNGGHWAGIVIDSATKEVAPDSAPQSDFNTPGSVSIAASTSGSGPTTFTGETSIGGSVSLAPSASTVFQGSTTIADHMVGQQGASTQFNGVTNIGQSVTGAQNSTFTFSGASTTIGGSIAGTTGSTMTFAGGATIGGNVEAAGDGGSFVFSQTAPTTIGGNVQLGQGASLKGGTVGTPITIAGAAVVNSGAVLGGNLVVTGPLSGTGGTLSPGNSVGTQRYGTSGEFSGAYVAEVNAAGKSDLIIIDNGNLNLAGVDLSVSQENGNGGYVLNHDYTIVQTVNGNVEGTFKSAALDSTFAGTLVNLDPVKYSQKDAKVSLSVDTSKVSAKRSGLSANQNATLDGVISVAGRNASADAALLSTDTGAAMNQLSGELHASTQSALLNSSSLLTNTIAKRMRGNVGAGMVAGAPVAQSSGSMPAGAMPSSAAYPLWAEVVGNWSSLDGNNNAAKVKSDTAGLFIGGDVGVGKGWRLGATLGFTDGKIKVNDRSSRSDVRSYTAAIYGGNSWATAKGSVNFLAGAGYTRHDIDSRRTVTVGGNQTLKADYKANTTHLFTELGYAMPVGKASVVEPYLGLAWISQRAKGFNESGGSAALSGQSQTDNVTTFTLGARGKTTIEAGRHEVRLSAGAGWRHAAGDVDASRKMSFIQGNGVTFQVAGAPIAKNAAVVDLGAEMTMGKNAAMGLAYSGQFGNGNTDSTGSLYLKYRFK